ncbi:MAG: hypothetical protein ACK56I_30545, partial [bacterium]
VSSSSSLPPLSDLPRSPGSPAPRASPGSPCLSEPYSSASSSAAVRLEPACSAGSSTSRTRISS